VDNELASKGFAAAVEPLIARLATLIARELGPRLTAELARQQGAHRPSARRLLTLDELVQLLPAGKKPATWKAWLYQKTRLGLVPGCHKLGGRLFFNPNETLPWLLNPATNGDIGPGVDLSGKQSLHRRAMADEPTDEPAGGGVR
jgi:hypothetical protein